MAMFGFGMPTAINSQLAAIGVERSLPATTLS
jgi:hypothetical protein